MTTKSVYHLIENNKDTHLSAKLIDVLEIVSISEEEKGNLSFDHIYPSKDQLHTQVINQKEAKDKLATRFNKYFINHIKNMLIDLIQPEYRYVLERMLEVSSYIFEDDPSKDNCLFSFMQFRAKGTDVDNMIVLYNAVKQYSAKFSLEKFNSNLTYSFPATVLLIDELQGEIEGYLHEITNLNYPAHQPECFLLRLGDFARDTFVLFGDDTVIAINQILTRHISNYEMIAPQRPDYLMLHIIET